MNSHHQLGRDAEAQALAWFCARRQCIFLAKNYRCKMGEIDLIFEEYLSESNQWELVFVEVRARLMSGWVDGPQSVVAKKQQRLAKTAAHFMMNYSGKAKTVRIDLLSWDGHNWSHLPALWLI